MKRFSKLIFILLLVAKTQTAVFGQLNASRMFYMYPVGGGVFFNGGYSFFNGQIGNYLTGYPCFNGGFFITNKKWYYDLRIYNVEGKITNGMPEIGWRNGYNINAVMVGVDFGYTVIRIPKLFVTPFIGIGHGHSSVYTDHDTISGAPLFQPNVSLRMDYNLFGKSGGIWRARGNLNYDREEHYMQITLTGTYYPFGLKPSVGLSGSILIITLGIGYYGRA